MVERAEIDLRLRGYHCSKLKSDETIIIDRRGNGRTEFAEMLDVLGKDVAVELIAVSDGEEDRVEFTDGAYVVLCDGGESNAERRHERGRRQECRKIG